MNIKGDMAWWSPRRTYWVCTETDNGLRGDLTRSARRLQHNLAKNLRYLPPNNAEIGLNLHYNWYSRILGRISLRRCRHLITVNADAKTEDADTYIINAVKEH